MYIPDNLDIYEYNNNEKERTERLYLRLQKELEIDKEEYESEQITDNCKPTTGHHYN
jgi:hypothetical protein